MEDLLLNITWQVCTTVHGLALLLSVIILPLAKQLGAKGRVVLITSVVAAQVLANVGFTVSGSWHANAILIGLAGSAAATGLYEWKDKIRNP